MLKTLARDLPKLWAATTTSDRDRKELLRTLISEIVVTVRRPENIAEIEVLWEGGARSELSIRLLRRGGERTRTDEDTIELIARLAVHHPRPSDRRNPQQTRPSHRHRAAVHRHRA